MHPEDNEENQDRTGVTALEISAEELVQARRDAKREHRLKAQLRKLPEATRYEYIQGCLSTRWRSWAKEFWATHLATSCLQSKKYILELLQQGFQIADASSIRLWLDFALKKLGSRQVVRLVRKELDTNPEVVDKALYWLAIYISPNEGRAFEELTDLRIEALERGILRGPKMETAPDGSVRFQNVYPEELDRTQRSSASTSSWLSFRWIYERIKARRKDRQMDPTSEVRWIHKIKSPWPVPILDVRPVTLGASSSSDNPQYASNAVSYGQDDGTSFVDKHPQVSRTIPANLEYRRDRVLADGALFIPDCMEQKWALYFHKNEILCIRSWQREVYATASVDQSDDLIRVTSIRGTFLGEEEAPEFTIRVLDYLLRTHALGMIFPAPIPKEMASDSKQAAFWCMSAFGKMARYATSDEIKTRIPDQPLRTHSLLHIATARGDREAADKQLRAGVPVDLLGADGLAPLHWALVCEGTEMLEFLLERGSPVDVRSTEGATPLMNAVQQGRADHFFCLLKNGADVNATDHRGFSSLHRAAEMGKIDLVRILLQRGAQPDIQAQGHTPITLAQKCGHQDIVRILDEGV